MNFLPKHKQQKDISAQPPKKKYRSSAHLENSETLNPAKQMCRLWDDFQQQNDLQKRNRTKKQASENEGNEMIQPYNFATIAYTEQLTNRMFISQILDHDTHCL
jgi:hypothetical protein